MASKNDLQIRLLEHEERTAASIQRWTTIRHGMTLVAIGVVIYMVMNTVDSIATKSPDAISALAKVVESLKLNQIVGAIGATLAASWAMVERHGRKRAIAKAGRLQRKLESQDAYKASSGLTSTGDTPEDDHD